MKKDLILVFLLFLSVATYSQKKTSEPVNPFVEIDKLVDDNNTSFSTLNAIAAFVDSTFKKEEDKCRAIYHWVTKNISYAPELMFTYKTSNKRTQLVKDVFENKTGICIGYATVFDTLCKLVKLPSYIIEGSTKQSFLPAIIGHAWCSVKINNTWQLFDPTWGSGYLQNNKFVRRLNNDYYFTDPDKLIKTHYPIDPIWQMKMFPITLYQFHTGAASTIKAQWWYQDSINDFLKLSEIEKITAMARRLNEFGTSSEVTANYYNYLKSKEGEYYTKKLNSAGNHFNHATEVYNDYINFKNKQFTPTKPDAEISKMMTAVTELVELSKAEILGVPPDFTEQSATYIQSINKQVKELESKIEQETIFVNRYISTKKASRKNLFYVKTIYGIPVK
ncbi:MAG: hypothetical protein JNJ40_10240 [Bacteroidia bacterium]|nr:hypothetical protein [Bacteroidia bacterium]